MTTEEKINEYNKNPIFCEECNKAIPYDGKLSLSKQYKKRFCDKTCRNIFIAHNRNVNNNYNSSNINKIENKICGIYCIENLDNHKKYIGQSTDIKDRLSHHMSNIKYGHSLVRNIREEMEEMHYDVNDFDFYILEECSQNILDDKEKYYIQLYKTYDSNYGYNEDLGGRFTPIRSEKHNIRLSETKKKQFENKNTSFYFNFLLGQDKTKKPILQIDNNGNIIKEWTKGATDISEVLNIPIRNIYNSIEKLNKTEGYFWIRKSDYSEVLINNLSNKRRKEKVFQYSFNGDLINKWSSAHEAKVNIGIDDKGIASACKGESLQWKGFIWSYIELEKEDVLKLVSKIPQYIITRNTPDKKVV